MEYEVPIWSCNNQHDFELAIFQYSLHIENGCTGVCYP